MSIALLEDAAAALGDLADEVVFLGAATLPLWITDPAAPSLRPTADVDVVVEVVTLIAYNEFEQRLRRAGFRDEGTVLGRFLFGPDDLQVDAIPADASILGFTNGWQRESIPDAVERTLPSGTSIRVLPAANLLATKLEAFADRGRGDFLGSPDFEDIVALVDGREELSIEVSNATLELRSYVAVEIDKHLREERALDAVVAHLEAGGDGRRRASTVVIPRLQQIVRAS